MTSNMKREISRNVPPQIKRSGNTVPLFTAYGCVLLERDTGKAYIYTAVNMKTGQREVLARRTLPLSTAGVEAMAEKIRLSTVTGAGILQADRPFGEAIALKNCQEMMNAVFHEVLPEHGYAVRKEQISLANHILNTLDKRLVSLAEAEVGTGKTLAYLVPAIIAKRGRLGAYWNMSYYTGTPYVELAHMPIVVATSSIALQRALVTDYIPELSRILMEHGVIKTPLSAALRKGREHYVCRHKLQSHIPFEKNPMMRELLTGLLKPGAVIDIAEIDGITPYIKRKISVPDRCGKNCPHREACAYLRFREQAASSQIDIQVCNHNYLIADILRRRDNQPPLIPNYQAIIIDEAHKFLGAARSMYGTELTSESIYDVASTISDLSFKYDDAQRGIHHAAAVLDSEGKRLFRKLIESVASNDVEDDADRFSVSIDADTSRHLRNIRNISRELSELLRRAPLSGTGKGRKAQAVWELEQLFIQTDAMLDHKNLICWLETSKDASKLCAIPTDLDRQLYDDLWSKGIPTVLTSGTLSAAGDFSRIKQSLGIERVGNRVTETSTPSPFDHKKNSLLYISENMPFPDQRDPNYILAAANEIEQLVYASHGHAAVLFTSYRVMDMVWAHLAERSLPFPLFRMDKGGVREIERFKQSGNGILFAAGAMWEGIDIPGDALSMLIIVKLPFAVPDPISEYERAQYDSMERYKELVLTPEMLVKLKQGAGRLIRMEFDTGAVALLDSRATKGGAYREIVLNALPERHVTNSLEDIERFFESVKSAEYFE